jgi:hypothetical protein
MKNFFVIFLFYNSIALLSCVLFLESNIVIAGDSCSKQQNVGSLQGFFTEEKGDRFLAGALPLPLIKSNRFFRELEYYDFPDDPKELQYLLKRVECKIRYILSKLFGYLEVSFYDLNILSERYEKRISDRKRLIGRRFGYLVSSIEECDKIKDRLDLLYEIKDQIVEKLERGGA